jgi:hypothetical protein
MGGWTSFLYIPKIQAYSTFEMARLCSMIAWKWDNIPRWGGYRLGWHGQKIPFLSSANCAISGYLKGLVDSRGHQRFSIVETDTQILKSHALLLKAGF